MLGQLLFLLYINDINSSSKDGLILLFADDTNIFVSDKSTKGVFNKTRAILDKVNNYMRCNLLHINIKKCCFMYFSPNKREMRNGGADEDDTILAIEGTIIKQVTETKLLGVTIDDKLSWKPHIEILNKKLKSLCGRIYRIKRALPEHLYKQLYHTLFESHLSYAISVWGGISLNQIKPLFLTQKKCIRIMFGDNEAFF